MKITNSQSGVSALIAVIVICVSALVLTRLAAGSALGALDRQNYYSEQSRRQSRLWNCAQDTLRIWHLSGQIPDSADSLDGTCAVAAEPPAGDNRTITISQNNRELILEVVKGEEIVINDYYFD